MIIFFSNYFIKYNKKEIIRYYRKEKLIKLKIK